MHPRPMPLRRAARQTRAGLLCSLAALTLAVVPAGAVQRPAAPRRGESAPAKAQTRPHGVAVAVDPDRVRVDDGDTVVIRWPGEEPETVRLLGIDTPETRHVEHQLPYSQPFGAEARAFARGVFAAATRIELRRAATVDPFGRTLGYMFVNGRNYSVLVVQARLAAESVTHYGDNGFPKEAAEVLAASKAAGPLPFEPPHQFRARMREVSRWLEERGLEAEP